MKRRPSSILGLLAILCGVSTAAKDRKIPIPDPTRGGIGVTIRVKGPTPLSVSFNASEAFFVRVEEDADILRAARVLTGRFSERNQVYLLNVEPGKYVVVGASYVPGKVGTSTFRQRNNVYFNKEMIPATAVTVEAGRIAFMGQIAAKGRHQPEEER